MRAWASLAEGRNDDALNAMRLSEERSFSYLSALANLATAHRAAGQADSARSLYERYTSFKRRALWVDQSNIPTAYRQLGALYEEAGDTENAVRLYNEFVELWKDADPELQPVVADVRARIAQLVGER